MASSRPPREDFDAFIARKMNDLAKLSAEHESLRTTTVAAPDDPDIERKLQHHRYLRLLAEKQVLEEMKPPELPSDPEFLYEWVKYKLIQSTNEDKENLEECKKERRILEAELDLLENPEDKSDNEEEIDDLLAKEEKRSEIIQNLLRKVVKRLRRLSQNYMRSNSKSVSTDAATRPKSFYKVLKEFVVELQDRTPGTNQAGVVAVNETFPREHLELLERCGIIEWVRRPYLMRLTPLARGEEEEVGSTPEDGADSPQKKQVKQRISPGYAKNVY